VAHDSACGPRSTRRKVWCFPKPGGNSRGLRRLKSTPDGDGTLLDYSTVLYGSSISNGNQYDYGLLPVVLAGGAVGQLEGGRHLKFAPHTPMSNLLLTVLDKLGVHQSSFGDSTGMLDV
jgi:hypothetical protein